MRSFSWDLTAKLLDTLKHLTRLTLAGYEVPPEIVDMRRAVWIRIRYQFWLSLEVGMFPIHITELKLNNFKFMDDPLVVLENLRSLRVLELAHSQVGFMMSCSAGGFQQLHQLQFVGLNNLEKLEIKAGAMPMLKVMMLSYCNNLQVPLGLRYLSNLKELNISWCHKLKKDEINIQDVCKHVPSINFGLDFVQEHLCSIPTEEELFSVLKSLGPHKAPGPDGFNAKMIQDNWEVFGPVVIQEATDFFRNGVMPSSIARSSLVLIPKTQDANRVGHFHPISVCNVIYKLISKTIAARIKPYISSCISPAQSAFVPGRDISENVILLREVLHSFKLKNYVNKEFCLKVDLSKAFDRMDWNFLASILPFYGFPPRLVQWIMACVKSAQCSVIINGTGDGYLKPECGLRQGCALSPYLFILGMDILSRQLQYLTDCGVLKGVKLAPSAVPITNCIYADDLLLFGSATTFEAETLMQTLQIFSDLSGQRVGPGKSSVWYSKATTEEERVAISSVLGVPNSDKSPLYLGAPISTTKGSYDFLIEKVSSKLQMWKGRLLSQAGRLVMIKSVVQSLPIYYMATGKIPAGVLKELTSLMRRFFWGAMDRERFLSYVAWDKLSEPLDAGGLAIRNLARVNEAMLMKSLWKLAAGSEALWVKIVHAKYMPRSDIWTNKRGSRCTVFWKGIMSLRPLLLPWLCWKLGNGHKCKAFAQPWAPGIMQFAPQNAQQRGITVRELKIQEEDTWDGEKLMQLFGLHGCMIVMSSVSPPVSQDQEDRLIFSPASNGMFSVKKAYLKLSELQNQNLSGVRSPQLQKEAWRIIWRKGSIVPRLRLFLWKLVHNALPLGAVLKARTSKGDSICAVCGEENEDAAHMVFLCSFARSCWFAGPLSVRTDFLTGNIHHSLVDIANNCSDDQWTLFVNSIWAIWRCRNDKAYSGKLPSFDGFSSYLRKINAETVIAKSARSRGSRVSGLVQSFTQGGADPSQLSQVLDQHYCYVDGSWVNEWRGGLGFVLTFGDSLVAYKSAGAMTSCPLQAEALALKDGMCYALSCNITSCVFLTDCQSLSDTVSQFHPPMDTDWRALDDIMQIWEMMKTNQGFVCRHIGREENGIADGLAKLGSREGYAWKYMGFTYPILPRC
ncbi:uncharacterized protein LOC144548322 [Carex rostrata]